MRKTYEKKIVIISALCILCGCACACSDKQAQATVNSNVVTSVSGQNEDEITYGNEQLQKMKHNIYQMMAGFTGLSSDAGELSNFADYLIANYDVNKISDIEVHSEESSFDEDGVNQKLYEATGKSVHVLWDEFKGLLTDENTSKANRIYVKNGHDGDVKISFAGDVCLTEDGYVIDHYDAVDEDISQCISKDIIDITNSADIFMLNHEYPVSTRGTALKGKYYTFRADPKREKILSMLGTDIVSLANNHIYDYGADAFYDTLESLNQEQIPFVGAGININEAKKPVYFIVNGMKIGIVSANRSEKNIFTPEAGENSPGVVRMYNTDMMKEIIKDTSRQCDYLIAYVHWGTEDSPYYEGYQTDIAKEFFDCGADALIGGHPHVLQGMEYIDGKPVVYSLGDFWFNAETKYTTILNLSINIQGLKEMSIVPCRQEKYTTHTLSGADADKFYKYMKKLSPDASIDSAGVVTPKQ